MHQVECFPQPGLRRVQCEASAHGEPSHTKTCPARCALWKASTPVIYNKGSIINNKLGELRRGNG
jgi:hypothetical protein